jgi:hypothetical protein
MQPVFTPTEFSWLNSVTKPVIPSHEVSGVIAGLHSDDSVRPILH